MKHCRTDISCPQKKCVDQANMKITRQERYGFTFPVRAGVASNWISVGQKLKHFSFDGMLYCDLRKV